MEHRASVLLFSCFALLCVVIIYQQYPNPNPNKEIASDIVNLPQTLRSNIERNLEEREPTRDIYHHKMYNYTSSKNSSTHKKAWMALAEVDGLKNEDVVMLITSTSVQNFKYIRERIISSARTWMRMLANTFVIVEDNFVIRFALRHCRLIETPHFTTFECHNEPTYVLSRKCTNEYYGGPGPCCKVDDLFTYLIWDRPDLFAHTKFALHADDDTYFRVDQVLRWLAVLDNSGINTFPIIANGNFDDPNENVWHIKGCTEIHTNGWYQPMVLNHAALDRLKYGAKEYGLAQTCSNFEVTHDVGMGPYAWMFGLYHIHIPHITVGNGGGRDAMPTDYLMIHAMKHGRPVDDCNKAEQWPDKERYDQKIVIGCGDINHPSPGHDPNGREAKRKDGSLGDEIVADMYDGWEWQRTHGSQSQVQYEFGQTIWDYANVTLYANGTKLEGISTIGDENQLKIKHILTDGDVILSDGTFQGDKVEVKYIPKILKLEGYNTTEHSKHYNILKKWHEFKLTDCKMKGEVTRRVKK